mmetsp:Transcript_49850/g.73232  ORF Transcript_49850/g.73232 Transcript_49850/m.73232 type:complete len:101 (-) Transcript_49850:266-568(-)
MCVCVWACTSEHSPPTSLFLESTCICSCVCVCACVRVCVWVCVGVHVRSGTWSLLALGYACNENELTESLSSSLAPLRVRGANRGVNARIRHVMLALLSH